MVNLSFLLPLPFFTATASGKWSSSVAFWNQPIRLPGSMARKKKLLTDRARFRRTERTHDESVLGGKTVFIYFLYFTFSPSSASLAPSHPNSFPAPFRAPAPPFSLFSPTVHTPPRSGTVFFSTLFLFFCLRYGMIIFHPSPKRPAGRQHSYPFPLSARPASFKHSYLTRIYIYIYHYHRH